MAKSACVQGSVDPGPDPWTAADVERWLLVPMRQLQSGAIQLHPGNALRPVDPHQPPSSYDILAFARTVLGKGSDELRAVVTWARITAQGGGGSSIAEWCRLAGWDERTFHRRRRRACEKIAAAKNSEELRRY